MSHMSQSKTLTRFILDIDKQVPFITARTQMTYRLLHCLLRYKHSSGTDIHHYIEVLTDNPLKYKMDNSILLYQDLWENPSE